MQVSHPQHTDAQCVHQRVSRIRGVEDEFATDVGQAEAVAAIGGAPAIVVDSGIRHGADIAVALARGADQCMIGRAFLYGLAAGGENGVRHAIDMLSGELRRTMQLCGVTTVAELRAAGDDIVVPA